MNLKKKGGFLISKIHNVSGRIFSRLLKDEGIEEINPAQGRILFALWEQDNIPISQLSKRTLLEKSTLTSMLDRLENSGYICRVSSPDDRRTILIKRTEKDRDLEKKYLEISEKMCNIFYLNMSDEQVKRFECDLEQILQNCLKEL